MRTQAMRLVSTRAMGLMVTAIAFACSGNPDAPTARRVASGPPVFVVSSPQAMGGGTRDAAGSGGEAPSEVVYVALPPGSIPNAELITISVHPTGVTVTAKPVDGGLDPVAVQASLGDTLYIDTRVSGSPVPVRNILPVGKHGRPVVIRTSPPHGKRDVPLNTDVLVVFSEPILPTSVSSSTVQLTSGPGKVAAQLAFTDSTHVMSTLTPLASLSPATDYTLRISQTIQDFAGETLAAPVTVTFTTEEPVQTQACPTPNPPKSTAILIASVSPASAHAGQGPLTVTISGAGFQPEQGLNGTEVGWSTQPNSLHCTTTWLATSFVSATQLTVVIPAALLKTSVKGYLFATFGDEMGISDGVSYPISNLIEFDVVP